MRAAIHVDQFLINHSPGSAIDPEAWPHASAFLDSLLEGAEQDDIVVSEAAVPFLERRFDLMPTPAGRAFRLAGRERGGSGLRRRLTAFVGRQHELELLRSRFESAASGRGQVVGIAGDAGVGKSRLLHEFRHSLAGRAVDYLQGQCLSYGSATPFLPVLDMLRITCRIARRDPPEVAAEKVRTFLHRLGMNPVERAPYLLHLLGLKEGIEQVTELSPEVIKVRIFDALRELTLRRSQRRPLVLALEDLHWIDETSEELFASMVQAIPSARIMLICVYRPGYRPAWIDKSYATQMALQPLPAGESLSFVQALLGSHDVSEAVVQAILARAEGNAFFLEELARSVREQRAPAPSLAVPDTVQEVLLARIDRLPPPERRLLQTAAVVGRDVPLSLLEAIAELSPEDLARGLSHLRAAEFLYETGVGAEVEYTFKHTLIQEVAYTSMADEDRRALHAAIVAATERLYADRLGEHIESLGHHAFAGGVWAKALTYLRQAGTKAARRSAHREAVACFEQALATLDHLPAGRDWSELAIDVRFDLRTSLLSLGELRRILRVMQEAEALASALGDQARLGRVAMYMGNYFSLVGDQARALETGRRALELATTAGDSRVRVEAHYRLGQIHCMLGDYRHAVETLEQCVKAVSGDLIRERFGALATLSVLARNWLVRSLAELGAFDDAVIRAEEAMRVAEATNQPIDLLIANQGMGFLHLRRGQLSRAVASLEQGVELCRSWHVPVWLPVVAAPLGAAYAMVERLDEAVSLLEQAVKEHAAMQRMGGHSLWVAWLAEAYLRSGRLDTASHLAGLALTLSQTHGERGHEAWILRLLGEIAARAEPADPSKVEDAYGRAAALAETLGMRPLVAHCHLGRGRFAGRRGDRTSATAQLTSAIVLLREMGMEFWLGQAESELSRL